MPKTIIPDDWTIEDGYTFMLACIPNSVKWKACLAGHVGNLTYGRTWDINTGNVKDATEMAEAIMESLSMDCGATIQALIDAVNGVNLTLQQQTPCGCEGIGTEMPQDPVNTPPDIGPGEDWETVEEYDGYKCLMSATIVHTLIQTQILLYNSNVEGYFAAFVAIVTAALQWALAAAKLIEISAELGKFQQIVSALITGEDLSLQAIADALDADRQALICLLYCSPTASGAENAYLDFVAELDLTATERAYLSLYAIPAVFNRLFTYQPDKLIAVLVADCSECGCSQVPCGFGFEFVDPDILGTGEFRYDGLPFTLSSVPFAGVNVLNYFVPCAVPGECEGTQWCIEFISSTIDVGLSASWNRRIYTWNAGCGTNVSNYDDEFPPFNDPMPMGIANFAGPNPFTVTMRIITGTGPTDQPPHLSEQCG